MSQELIRCERQGPVAYLTLNRPDKRNALNRELVEALSAILRELASETELRCVVMKGAGEKAFVAGADIGELLERDAEQSLAGINSSLFLQVEEFPVPVIAMIRGWCLGGGMELAMACDLRIAGESARFGQPELKLGILPAAGGLHRLPALVGMGQAKDFVLTGKIVGAEEALRMGLVSRLVPDEELEDATERAAEEVVATAPLASRLAKKTMHALFRVRPDTAFMVESAAQAVLFESEEKKKRMRDFLEQSREKRGGKR